MFWAVKCPVICYGSNRKLMQRIRVKYRYGFLRRKWSFSLPICTLSQAHVDGGRSKETPGEFRSWEKLSTQQGLEGWKSHGSTGGAWTCMGATVQVCTLQWGDRETRISLIVSEMKQVHQAPRNQRYRQGLGPGGRMKTFSCAFNRAKHHWKPYIWMEVSQISE